MIALGKGLCLWALFEKDRVCVVVEDSISQYVRSIVQFETRPTGGETRHENVQVGCVGDVFGLRGVMNFSAVFRQDADVAHVKLVTVKEFGKVLKVHEFFDLASIQALTEFSPK